MICRSLPARTDAHTRDRSVCGWQARRIGGAPGAAIAATYPLMGMALFGAVNVPALRVSASRT